MNRAIALTLVGLLSGLLLCACGTKWVKPGLAPAEQQSLLERDSKRCQDEVDRLYALPDDMAGGGYGPQYQDDALYNQQITRPGALDDYREDYDIRETRRLAFRKCMIDRGWSEEK